MKPAVLATGFAVTLLFAAVALLPFQASANAEELPAGSCQDPLVVVDKEYSLSPLYAPPDLVFIGDYGVPATGWNGLLREEAAEHLADLVSAAEHEGRELAVASAHRSFYEQSLAYSSYTEIYGLEAGRVSAMPGHSEHQLGTTVDFTNASVGYEILQDFGYTEAAGWLRENAAEYGFVLSYPEGEEEKTGYVWEPWHYRYVSVEAAREIRDKKLDARDFLLKEGVRPDCS
ncbi:MAG: M15 family metallopeptidase [Rubrobacteraceae bacterium]